MNEIDRERKPVVGGREDILRRVLNVLMPGGHGMPSAVEVGADSTLLSSALRVRPDLESSLGALLERFSEYSFLNDHQALRRISLEEPEVFARATTLLSGAYFMSDEVRSSINYPGQEARRLDEDLSSYLDMLERVVERGPIYRSVDGQVR